MFFHINMYFFAGVEAPTYRSRRVLVALEDDDDDNNNNEGDEDPGDDV